MRLADPTKSEPTGGVLRTGMRQTPVNVAVLRIRIRKDPHHLTGSGILDAGSGS
jgi:hypothetical protein